MKAIDAIIRGGKTFVDQLFSITKNKITRAINSAFDSVDENIYNEEIKKIKALQSLADAADDSEKMKSAFNAYHEACEKIRSWKEYREDLKSMQKDLDKEVEEKED